MNPTTYRKLLSWIAVPCVSLMALAAAAVEPTTPSSAVKITPEDKVIQITIGDKPFTTYHFADDLAMPYVRPFLWPVHAADGTEVTSDQTQAPPDAKGKKPDHPHHRSIWVGHQEVNGANHWDFTAKPIPKQRHLRFSRIEGDSIEEELDWEGKDGKSIVLHETRTLRFLPYADGSRGIDITCKFTPAEGDVVFGDVKDAGFASVRVSNQISAKPTLINSGGAQGEKMVWGKPADWVDESGMIDGKPYGIAIFDDPKNPRYPTTWHAREYGLVTPNEFGWHDFDKTKPKGAGDFKVEKDKPATFHYRIVIHAGDAAAAQVAGKYGEFSGAK